MMQPDNLFKNKLEHYAKPAPAMAWDKIESRLDKKDRGVFWLKIAASVAFVSLATFIFWPRTNEVESQLANNDTIESIEPDVVEKQIPSEEITVDTKSSDVTVKLKSDKTFALKTEPHERKSLLEIEESTTQTLIAEKETYTQSIESVKIETSELTASSEVESISSEFTSTTIVYTSEDASRFLKKNNTEATSTEKKSSGIQKLLTLAADIKNNETGFGELREMKNEILALNFREDKKGVNK